METPDILWERELPVPKRFGKRLPAWAIKYFKEVWSQYARKHEYKYTSEIKFTIVGEDDFDIIWRASRTCKPKYVRPRAVPVALFGRSGISTRTYKHLLAETDDERRRLDLLASHGVVVVSPLRGGGLVGNQDESGGEPEPIHEHGEYQAEQALPRLRGAVSGGGDGAGP